MLDTAARKIRFAPVVEGKVTHVGKIVSVGNQSGILKSGQTYVRDPDFPWLLVAGFVVCIMGTFIAALAALILGVVGLAAGLVMPVIGVLMVVFGLRKWRATVYFLMREGDPRPLTVNTTVDLMHVDETLAPAPYDAEMFQQALKSDIATRFMRPSVDFKRIMLYVLVAMVILGIVAGIAGSL